MAGGKDIPSNSLLQSAPEFELSSKAKPIINREHTSAIENMNKLRVSGEDWDDVIPCALTDVGSRREEDEAPEVSQEKPKLFLGELYETMISKEGHEIGRRGRGKSRPRRIRLEMR